MKVRDALRASMLTLCLLCLATLQGCIIAAPFVESFKSVGATEGDRKRLFDQTFKKFAEGMYWGQGTAANYLHEDADPALRKELKRLREDIKVVDSKVVMTDFTESAYQAEIELVVKQYKVPFYIVQDQRESQIWKFSIANGWKLLSRQMIKE